MVFRPRGEERMPGHIGDLRKAYIIETYLEDGDYTLWSDGNTQSSEYAYKGQAHTAAGGGRPLRWMAANQKAPGKAMALIMSSRHSTSSMKLCVLRMPSRQEGHTARWRPIISASRGKFCGDASATASLQSLGHAPIGPASKIARHTQRIHSCPSQTNELF